MAEYYRQRPRVVTDYMPELPEQQREIPVDAAPFTKEDMLDFLAKAGNVMSVPLSYATSQIYTGDTKSARESEASKNFLEQLRSIENPFDAENLEAGVRRLDKGLTKVGKAIEKPMPTSETYLKELEKNPDTYSQYKTGGLSFLGSGLADAYKNTDSELGKSAIAMGSDFAFDPMNSAELLGPIMALGQTRAMKEAKKALELSRAEALAKGMTNAEFNESKLAFADAFDQKLKEEAAQKSGQWNKANKDDFYHSKNISSTNKFDRALADANKFIKETTVDAALNDEKTFNELYELVKNKSEFSDKESLKRRLESMARLYGSDKSLSHTLLNPSDLSPKGFTRLGAGSYQTAYRIDDMPDKVLKRHHNDINKPGLGEGASGKEMVADQSKFTRLHEKKLGPKVSSYATNNAITQIQDFLTPASKTELFKQLGKDQFENLLSKEFIPTLNEELSKMYDTPVKMWDVDTKNVGFDKSGKIMPLDLNVEGEGKKIKDFKILEQLLDDLRISKDKYFYNLDSVVNSKDMGKLITSDKPNILNKYLPTDIEEFKKIAYEQDKSDLTKRFKYNDTYIHNIINIDDFEKMVDLNKDRDFNYNENLIKEYIEDILKGQDTGISIDIPKDGNPSLSYGTNLNKYLAYKQLGIDKIPIKYKKVRK